MLLVALLPSTLISPEAFPASSALTATHSQEDFVLDCGVDFDWVYPGENVTFWVRIHNRGLTVAPKANVTLTLPSGLDGDTRPRDLGAVGLNQSRLFEYPVKVRLDIGPGDKEIRARVLYGSRTKTISTSLHVRESPIEIKVEDPSPSTAKSGEPKEIKVSCTIRIKSETGLEDITIHLDVDSAIFEVLRGSFHSDYMTEGESHTASLEVRTKASAKTGDYYLAVKITFSDKSRSHNIVERKKVSITDCLVVTAAFGSALTGKVQSLRNFRDQYIMKTRTGRSFMKCFDLFYYAFSPSLAGFIGQDESLRALARVVLYPMFVALDVAAATYFVAPLSDELAAILSGAVATGLLGAFYIAPILSILLFRRETQKKVGRGRPRIVEASLLMLCAGLAVVMVGELLSKDTLGIGAMLAALGLGLTSAYVVASVVAKGAVLIAKMLHLTDHSLMAQNPARG